MKKLGLFLSVLISNVAIAQTTSISGYLIDKNSNEALQYANVQIYSLPDSTFIKGDATKDDGSFSIESSKFTGKMLVRASFIGYNSVDKNIEVVKGQDNKVGKIYLQENAEQLAEGGLRTLVICQKLLDDEFFDGWIKVYKKACISMKDRKKKIEETMLIVGGNSM